jgi:hypothetical protein
MPRAAKSKHLPPPRPGCRRDEPFGAFVEVSTLGLQALPTILDAPFGSNVRGRQMDSDPRSTLLTGLGAEPRERQRFDHSMQFRTLNDVGKQQHWAARPMNRRLSPSR